MKRQKLKLQHLIPIRNGYCFFPLLLIWLFSFSIAHAQINVHQASSNQTSKKPNVVIIMADDLDSRQLSCYGGQNLQTTNIDRLAKEGIKFNNMIASEAMCVPTRASLFTGLYPARHGAYQNHKPVYAGLKSVVHYLQDENYRVALSGKDHVTRPRAIFPFQIIPGFETNCVAASDEYSLDSIAEFIGENKDPFCLFIMSINPHAPWTVGDPSEFDPAKLKLPAHWVDTEITRKQFTNYLAEVRRLDNQVGDIISLLEQNNQLENTIIIFLGEQGPQFPGGKWTLYDNGQKSSMLIRWPMVISPNSQTDAIVQFEDITPTLVAIAGGSPDPKLDGKSFLPVITKSKNNHREYAFGIHNNYPEGPAYPMRSIRDSRYKLIVNLLPDSNYYNKFMMNPKNKKSVYTSWLNKAGRDQHAQFLTQRIAKHPAVEFYDLLNDPDELTNLADDVDQQERIKVMRSNLAQWMKVQGDSGSAMDIPLVKP